MSLPPPKRQSPVKHIVHSHKRTIHTGKTITINQYYRGKGLVRASAYMRGKGRKPVESRKVLSPGRYLTGSSNRKMGKWEMKVTGGNRQTESLVLIADGIFDALDDGILKIDVTPKIINLRQVG